MSRINFISFRRTHPDLSVAWDQLEGWLQCHPEVRFLESDRLGRELSAVPAWILTQALNSLAVEGDLQLKYMVRSPDGHLLQGTYENPGEVPGELPDRFHQFHFKVKDENILPVFFVEQESSGV